MTWAEFIRFVLKTAPTENIQPLTFTQSRVHYPAESSVHTAAGIGAPLSLSYLFIDAEWFPMWRLNISNKGG